MPAAIWVFLLFTAGPIVLHILTALGIGYVVYEGVQLGLDAVYSYAQNQIGALPEYVIQLLGILQIDTAMAMLIAAHTAKITILGVNAAITKWSLRQPTITVPF